MNNDSYKSILAKAPFGYAYYKTITDEKGNPVDYEFLEVNAAFESITGFEASHIIGKTVCQLMPGIKNSNFDLTTHYDYVAINGGESEFEQFSEPLNKWYRVQTSSPERGFLTTVFIDITSQKKLASIAQIFLTYNPESIDYQFILDTACEITGASYASFNIFDENGHDFYTVAISGLKQNLKLAIDKIGIKVLGKKWDFDPVRQEKIKHKKTTLLAKFSELTGHAISPLLLDALSVTFNIGHVAVVKAEKNGMMLGDFTLLFTKGKRLQNQPMIETLADMTGLLLDRLHQEQKITFEQLKLKQITSQITDIVWRSDLELNITYVSPSVERILGFTVDEFLALPLHKRHPQQDVNVIFSLFKEEMDNEKNPEIDKQRSRFVELQHYKSDGSQIPIEIHINFVRDENGIPIGLQGISHDITERKQSELKLQKSKQSLESFLAISQSIAHASDLTKLMRLIVDNAVNATGFQSSAIYLIEGDNSLKLEATYPPLPENLPDEFKITQFDNHPHIYKAIKTGESVLLPDIFKVKLTPQEFEIAKIRNLRSILYIPINLRTQPIGVLILGSCGETYDFIEEEIELLMGYAAEAAQIIDANRNYNEVKRYAEELERNINERKQIEEILRVSERKFRLLTDNALDTIWTTDLQFKITYVNNSIKSFLGYTPEEFMGILPEKGTLPEGLLTIQNAAEKLMADYHNGIQSKQLFNVKQYKKDGTLIDVEIVASLLLNDDGEPVGFQGRSNDITERKVLEENLKLETQLCEILMEISSGFINIPLEEVDVAVDNALESLGRFVNADRSYIFDYNWQDRVCTNTKEWCEVDIEPEIQNLQQVPLEMMPDWVAAHKRGDVVLVEDVIALPKGYVRDLLEPQGIKSVVTVPMMNKGNCIGFVGFDSVKQHRNYSIAEQQLLKVFAQMLVNVTLRKDMVKQLINAKNKAEESDRLKSAFLSNMSHEIRTPMNGILGFLELLKESNLDEEERLNYINIVNKSGNRLLETINDIIEISKIESGDIIVDKKSIELQPFLSFYYEFFLPQAKEKGILLNPIQMEDQLKYVFTDKTKLDSILTNLIKNALKFTAVGFIEFGCNKLNSNEILFFVKDTGKGIKAEKVNAIFERFVQEDISNTRGHEGSGLGLSITKSYVEALGGRIWVDSQPGIGSCFYFTISSAPPQLEGFKSESETINVEVNTQASNAQLHVLIAEDDDTSYLFLKAILKPYNYQISRCSNGFEAIEFYKSNPDIDVIFMDIKMPGMDGYQATRAIRQFDKDVYIIAQTAFALVGDDKKAKEAGCNFYISKPINRDVLLEILKKVQSKSGKSTG